MIPRSVTVSGTVILVIAYFLGAVLLGRHFVMKDDLSGLLLFMGVTAVTTLLIALVWVSRSHRHGSQMHSESPQA
jgi:uncharacterized membrane protein